MALTTLSILLVLGTTAVSAQGWGFNMNWFKCMNRMQIFSFCPFQQSEATLFVEYDQQTHTCQVRETNCGFWFGSFQSFRSVRECELSCGVQPTTTTTTTTTRRPPQPYILQPVLDKCSYQVPEITCAMAFEPILIYDAGQGVCRTLGGGCSREDLEPFEFSSYEECNAECNAGGIPAPEPLIKDVDKCNYQFPPFTCYMLFPEPVTMYDPRTDTCRVVSGGCSREALIPYSFESIGDCELECKLPPPPPIVDRCSYELPEVTCAMLFKTPVTIYDSTTDSCRVIRGGCSREVMVPYSFETTSECEYECRGVLPSPTIPSTRSIDKCTYELEPAQTRCRMAYVKPVHIFDAKTGRCQTLGGGCNPRPLLPFSFETLEQCQESCETSVSIDKCSFELKGQDRCRMRYSRPLTIFNSETGECRTLNGGCNPRPMRKFSFESLEQCQVECIMGRANMRNLPDVVVPPPVDKCSFQLQGQDRCRMKYLHPVIIFDSINGQCQTLTGGCSPLPMVPYSFESTAECTQQCLPDESGSSTTVTPDPVDKCTPPPRPEVMCYMLYERPLIVFEPEKMQCKRIYGGCDMAAMLPYSFNSFVACEVSCGMLAIEPPMVPLPDSNAPTTTVDPKCSFVKPLIGCASYEEGSQTYISYDSVTDQCYSIKECVKGEIRPYSFESFISCEMQCKQLM